MSLLSLLAVSHRGGVEATFLVFIPALFLAHYLADLLSGLIHWVCDSFGCASTPFWGPALIGPFRHQPHRRDEALERARGSGAVDLREEGPHKASLLQRGPDSDDLRSVDQRIFRALGRQADAA